MSYPVFFIVGVGLACLVGAALAGPLSVFAVLGFWVAHYFFLEWRNKKAPLEAMSDHELTDVLDWWTGWGPFGRNTPAVLRIRSTGTAAELKAALERIVCIYDEQIRRAASRNLSASNYVEKRDSFVQELSRLST